MKYLLVLLMLSYSCSAQQTNLADLLQPTSEPALKRQKQDTFRQLGWMDGCVKAYDNDKPIYDTACVLALKNSEEAQRERGGNGIVNSIMTVVNGILLFKGL